jgi:hypothetical protein
MTILSQLSRRDVERLSAYLDGALSSDERDRLEERFHENPDLRSALEEMRMAVWLMRSMPEVKPPRSFTLTPEMVGIRERPRAYPIFQLATVLATLALVVVVGIDFFSPFASGRVASTALESAPVEEAVGEMDEPSAAGAAQEEIAELEPQTFAAEPEVEGGVDAPAPAVDDAMERAEPTPCPDCRAEDLELGNETEEPPALALKATDVPPPVEEVQDEPQAEAEAPLAMLTPTQAPTSAAPSPTPLSPAVGETQVLDELPAPPVPPLRWIEVGLGAVAALLAAITFWMRKRGS